MPLTFDLLHTDVHSQARLGQLHTPHGTFDTPVFMPIGTQATVKTLRTSDLLSCGAKIILCNSYHLFLRPGHDLIRSFGGLQTFMGWPSPILTDSGGFKCSVSGPWHVSVRKACASNPIWTVPVT